MWKRCQNCMPKKIFLNKIYLIIVFIIYFCHFLPSFLQPLLVSFSQILKRATATYSSYASGHPNSFIPNLFMFLVLYTLCLTKGGVFWQVSSSFLIPLPFSVMILNFLVINKELFFNYLAVWLVVYILLFATLRGEENSLYLGYILH